VKIVSSLFCAAVFALHTVPSVAETASVESSTNRTAHLPSKIRSNVVSITKATPISSVSFAIEQNINRPGKDYRGQANSLNADACRNICAQEDQCVAFTWVRPGVQGPDGKCWLKNEPSTPELNNDTISGLKIKTLNKAIKGK
jgi:hypothetical protein